MVRTSGHIVNESDIFHAEVDFWEVFSQLLDCDEESNVFIKDRDSVFVWMNRRMLAFVGADPEHYVGTNDLDYFPADLVQRFLEEDQRVMNTRRAIRNLPQIVTDHAGQMGWFILNKAPILNRQKTKVIGLIGMLRDYTRFSETIRPLHEMQDVISYILCHYPKKILVEELAQKVFLSVSQFNRRFSQMFQMTPCNFILKVRLDATMRLLSESDLPMTTIALRCGFYDSSAFASQFRKRIGCSPLEFRKKYTNIRSSETLSTPLSSPTMDGS